MNDAFTTILTEIGEDPSREGLRDTPKRAAKAMQFLTSGYKKTVEEIVNNALFESDSNEMIVVQDIELYSMCEHHLLPFIGKCHVAYIPTGKVLGLSKVARIVEMFARRLQIQENLTKEVAETIQSVTAASGVSVIIEAKHMCMMMRGVEKQNSSAALTRPCLPLWMNVGKYRDQGRVCVEPSSRLRTPLVLCSSYLFATIDRHQRGDLTTSKTIVLRVIGSSAHWGSYSLDRI